MSPPPMLSMATAQGGMPTKSAGAFFSFMGIDRDEGHVYQSLRDFGKAPADEAWVFACVDRRMRAVQSVPLRVYVRDGRDRIDNIDANDAAATDLQYLLDDVNPESEGSELQAYTEGGACVWGGSYWKKVRGKYGGPPQELYWLPGPNVEPNPARSIVESYTYTPGGTGEKETILARDMVPFRYPNLQDPRKLLSPLSSVRFEIEVNRSAAEWNASTLRNWGVPAGAWVIEKGEEIAPTEVNTIKRILRGLRGPKNAGKSPVLPVPLRWQALALNPKDADWLASRKVSRMAVCAALGVPLVLAGDDEKTSVYANLRDAERIFWRNTVIAQLDWTAAKINSWLTPEFDDKDPRKRHLVVAYDYAGIEALQPTWPDLANVWNQAASGHVVTDDEMRQHIFRLPPLTPEQTKRLDEQRVISAPKPPMGFQDKGQVEKPDPAQKLLSLGKALYQHPSVKAFIAGDELDTSFLGDAEPVIGTLLEVGLTRRYTAEQLVGGVPAEGYPGFPVRTP